jgi:hypothetical protein
VNHWLWSLIQIRLRVGNELFPAARIAEIIGFACKLELPGGARRINRHAADRINVRMHLPLLVAPRCANLRGWQRGSVNDSH